MKKLVVVLLLAIFIATSVAIVGNQFAPSSDEITPPEDIWSYNQYKANTHTHTNRSFDSSTWPQDRVYQYQNMGYDILAISDHYFGCTSFEDIGVTDYYITPICSNEAEGVIAHINIFYTYVHFAIDTPENIFQMVEDGGGIAVLNHPGKYDNVTNEQRIKWFTDYPSIIGMEIVNRNDRYENDREIWDACLTALMPERNIYGMGTDDTHDTDDIGWSFTMFQAPDRSEESIEYAFRNGHFYTVTNAIVYAVKGNEPRITRISQNEDGSYTIEGTNYNKVTWISCGEIVSNEATFNPIGCEKYIRAELEGDGGVAFSQPIPLY
ncbi:MAG: hypothetical protein IKB56_02680 [Clostridia bacterium]|nr:hypothetical protein [Clostridia bacterium]